MVANISFVNGKAEAFTSLTPAWWDRDKEYVADSYLTSEEVWGERGLLNFEYEMLPIYDEGGQKIPGFLRSVRADTGTTIGVGMTERYKPVQPREAFDWMDGLMKDGVMKYASAGVLNGGKQIWVLGLIPNEGNEVDNFRKYVLWLDDFTAAHSLLWFPCFTRVECENTANAAKGEREKNKFRGIRHMGDMDAKLNAARSAIIESEAAFQRYNADCRKLLETRFTRDQAVDFIEELFPVPKDENGKPKTGRSNSIRERKVEAIRNGMKAECNRGPDMVGTFYQLYNAVTFAVDHGNVLSFKGKNDKRKTNRWISLMTGTGADLKAKALEIALAIAG